MSESFIDLEFLAGNAADKADDGLGGPTVYLDRTGMHGDPSASLKHPTAITVGFGRHTLHVVGYIRPDEEDPKAALIAILRDTADELDRGGPPSTRPDLIGRYLL